MRVDQAGVSTDGPAGARQPLRRRSGSAEAAVSGSRSADRYAAHAPRPEATGLGISAIVVKIHRRLAVPRGCEHRPVRGAARPHRRPSAAASRSDRAPLRRSGEARTPTKLGVHVEGEGRRTTTRLARRRHGPRHHRPPSRPTCTPHLARQRRAGARRRARHDTCPAASASRALRSTRTGCGARRMPGVASKRRSAIDVSRRR